jgi:hypothetical protein
VRSLARDRHRLACVEGLRFSRHVFVGGLGTEGFTIGPVDPRRQMALCIWDGEQALDRFLQGSPIGRSWRRSTDEYCELRMDPLRSHGSYRGQQPLADMPPSRRSDGPAALWTFANIPPRGLLPFWSSIRHATRELMRSPGLIAGTAGPERMYSGAMTFTIWDCADHALAFAYRREPHKDIVRRVRDEALLTDSMFIRLRPYHVVGRWPARSRFAARFESFARALD